MQEIDYSVLNKRKTKVILMALVFFYIKIRDIPFNFKIRCYTSLYVNKLNCLNILTFCETSTILLYYLKNNSIINILIRIL